MKRALITGITGQDGSYLAELLLDKGYEVHGVARRTSTMSSSRIHHLRDRIHLHQGDLLDQGALIRLLRECQPDEVYNLGAQSFVPTSFTNPILTGEFTALGVTRLLEALRLNDLLGKTRFYQASSSEMFGKARAPSQNEDTPFYPRSPYGVAKVYGHHITVNYRESYGIHASSGIMFNHESPRRGLEFVTRRISSHVALIKHGIIKDLRLGNIEAKRDWGYARDYVEAMWLMLQKDEARDYVIATGQTHSVREFCEIAFQHVGLNWEDHVRFDQSRTRPAEVDYLKGDASLADAELGWSPKLDFPGLVKLMVDKDLERVARYGQAIIDSTLWYL